MFLHVAMHTKVYRILDILGSSHCPEIDLTHRTALLVLLVFRNEILFTYLLTYLHTYLLN